MKKQLRTLLLAVIVIPCMVISAACGGHKHTWSTTWSKDADNHWHVCSCGEVKDKAPHNWDAGIILAGNEPTFDATGTRTFTCQTADCGQTKTETAAILVPLFASAADFIAAVLDKEGNFSATLTFTEQDNEGGSSTQSKIFGISGLNSFAQETYSDGDMYEEYDQILDEDLLVYYCRDYDYQNDEWDDWGYGSGDYESAFLFYAEIDSDYKMSSIDLIDILQDETFAQDQTNPNKYSFQDDDYLYEIEISADDVVITITGEYISGDYEASATAIYTFTNFGTTEVEIPAAARKEYDTEHMFGMEPDSFRIDYSVFVNESPQWTWEGNKFVEVQNFILSKGFKLDSGSYVPFIVDKNLIGNTFVCIYEGKLALVGPMGENDSMYVYFYTIDDMEGYLDSDYYDEVEGVSYNEVVALYSNYEVNWVFYGEDRTNEFKQILISTGEWELDESYSYTDTFGGIAATWVYIENDVCIIGYTAASGAYNEIRLTKITD